MRLRNKIGNITFPISFLNDKYFIIGVNNEFQLFDGSDVVGFKDTKIKETGFKKIKNKLYFFDEKKITQIDLETLNGKVFLEFQSDELWLLNDGFYLYANKTTERREYKFDYYSKVENRILWSAIDKLELTNLSNKFLIFSNLNRTIYARYNIISGMKIWTLDFSENRINGNVLLIDNVLVFPTTNQDLIGIEIETGKELWRLPNCNLHHQQQPNTNYLVGLASNSFGDNFYQVIDPISGKKLIDKKFKDFFYETQPTLACITATHYYFISNVIGDGTGTKSERLTHLGCINLQTHEIEWIEKVGTTADRRSSFQKPEINGNKIYLLNGEQTLHIYELER